MDLFTVMTICTSVMYIMLLFKHWLKMNKNMRPIHTYILKNCSYIGHQHASFTIFFAVMKIIFSKQAVPTSIKEHARIAKRHMYWMLAMPFLWLIITLSLLVCLVFLDTKDIIHLNMSSMI